MTVVMGILNVTADSFSDGGRYLDPAVAIEHGLALRAAGADIVDVGGESTRPGADRVAPAREEERVVPVIAALTAAGVSVSIDTMNASTAVAAVAAGARLVNDVSGGLADPDMFAAVAPTGADIAIGHWRGHSADMYAGARYADLVGEVLGELQQRIVAAADAGIDPSRIVLDPGIGFGKTAEQNWTVLRHLDRLVGLGRPLLVGTSRKRFLTDAFASSKDTTATDAAPGGHPVDTARRDAATAATSVLAAEAGVWGVRVHDVAATRDALAVQALWRGRS